MSTRQTYFDEQKLKKWTGKLGALENALVCCQLCDGAPPEVQIGCFCFGLVFFVIIAVIQWLADPDADAGDLIDGLIRRVLTEQPDDPGVL